ncbi:hypothetical protein EV424DRAFT_1341494 [Suillus variegatus]|nr:hypothetical protein EV424DRAFT_1341494 [Suillus variegatus]
MSKLNLSVSELQVVFQIKDPAASGSAISEECMSVKEEVIGVKIKDQDVGLTLSVLYPHATYLLSMQITHKTQRIPLLALNFDVLVCSRSDVVDAIYFLSYLQCPSSSMMCTQMPSTIKKYFNCLKLQPSESKDSGWESRLTLEAGMSGVLKLPEAFYGFSGIIHKGVETETNKKLTDVYQCLLQAGINRNESKHEAKLKETLAILQHIFPGTIERFIKDGNKLVKGGKDMVKGGKDIIEGGKDTTLCVVLNAKLWVLSYWRDISHVLEARLTWLKSHDWILARFDHHNEHDHHAAELVLIDEALDILEYLPWDADLKGFGACVGIRTSELPPLLADTMVDRRIVDALIVAISGRLDEHSGSSCAVENLDLATPLFTEDSKYCLRMKEFLVLARSHLEHLSGHSDSESDNSYMDTLSSYLPGLWNNTLIGVLPYLEKFQELICAWDDVPPLLVGPLTTDNFTDTKCWEVMHTATTFYAQHMLQCTLVPILISGKSSMIGCTWFSAHVSTTSYIMILMAEDKNVYAMWIMPFINQIPSSLLDLDINEDVLCAEWRCSRYLTSLPILTLEKTLDTHETSVHELEMQLYVGSVPNVVEFNLQLTNTRYDPSYISGELLLLLFHLTLLHTRASFYSMWTMRSGRMLAWTTTLEVDRCIEEETHLILERSVMQEWMFAEWEAIQTVLRDAAPMWKNFCVSGIIWKKKVQEIPCVWLVES